MPCQHPAFEPAISFRLTKDFRRGTEYYVLAGGASDAQAAQNLGAFAPFGSLRPTRFGCYYGVPVAVGKWTPSQDMNQGQVHSVASRYNGGGAVVLAAFTNEIIGTSVDLASHVAGSALDDLESIPGAIGDALDFTIPTWVKVGGALVLLAVIASAFK